MVGKRVSEIIDLCHTLLWYGWENVQKSWVSLTLTLLVLVVTILVWCTRTRWRNLLFKRINLHNPKQEPKQQENKTEQLSHEQLVYAEPGIGFSTRLRRYFWVKSKHELDFSVMIPTTDDNKVITGSKLFIKLDATLFDLAYDEFQLLRVEPSHVSNNTTAVKIIDKLKPDASMPFNAVLTPGTYWVRFAVYDEPAFDNSFTRVADTFATIRCFGPIDVIYPRLTPLSTQLRWNETIALDVQTLHEHHADDKLLLRDRKNDFSLTTLPSIKLSEFSKHVAKQSDIYVTFRCCFSNLLAPNDPGEYKVYYYSGLTKKVWSATEWLQVLGPELSVSTIDGRLLCSSDASHDGATSNPTGIYWNSTLMVNCLTSNAHATDDLIVLRKVPGVERMDTTASDLSPLGLTTPVSSLDWSSIICTDDNANHSSPYSYAMHEPKLPDDITFHLSSAANKHSIAFQHPRAQHGQTNVHVPPGYDSHLVSSTCHEPGTYFILYLSRGSAAQQPRTVSLSRDTRGPYHVLTCAGPISVVGPELFPCSPQSSLAQPLSSRPLDSKLSEYAHEASSHVDSELIGLSPQYVVDNGCRRWQQPTLWWGAPVSTVIRCGEHRSHKDRIILQTLGEVPRAWLLDFTDGNTSENKLSFEHTLSAVSTRVVKSASTGYITVLHLAATQTLCPTSADISSTSVSLKRNKSVRFSVPGSHGRVRAFPRRDNTWLELCVSGENEGAVEFLGKHAPPAPGVYRFVYKLHDNKHMHRMDFCSPIFIVSPPVLRLTCEPRIQQDEYEMDMFWGQPLSTTITSSPFREQAQDYIAFLPVIRRFLSQGYTYDPVAEVEFTGLVRVGPTVMHDSTQAKPPVISMPLAVNQQIQKFQFDFEREKSLPRPGLWQLVYYGTQLGRSGNSRPTLFRRGPIVRVQPPDIHVAVAPYTEQELEEQRSRRWFSSWTSSQSATNAVLPDSSNAKNGHTIYSSPPRIRAIIRTSPNASVDDAVAIVRVGGSVDNITTKEIKILGKTSTEVIFEGDMIPREPGEYQIAYIRGGTGPSFFGRWAASSDDISQLIYNRHPANPDEAPTSAAMSARDVIARSVVTFRIDESGAAIQTLDARTSLPSQTVSANSRSTGYSEKDTTPPAYRNVERRTEESTRPSNDKLSSNFDILPNETRTFKPSTDDHSSHSRNTQRSNGNSINTNDDNKIRKPTQSNQVKMPALPFVAELPASAQKMKNKQEQSDVHFNSKNSSYKPSGLQKRPQQEKIGDKQSGGIMSFASELKAAAKTMHGRSSKRATSSSRQSGNASKKAANASQTATIQTQSSTAQISSGRPTGLSAEIAAAAARMQANRSTDTQSTRPVRRPASLDSGNPLLAALAARRRVIKGETDDDDTDSEDDSDSAGTFDKTESER